MSHIAFYGYVRKKERGVWVEFCSVGGGVLRYSEEPIERCCYCGPQHHFVLVSAGRVEQVLLYCM